MARPCFRNMNDAGRPWSCLWAGVVPFTPYTGRWVNGKIGSTEYKAPFKFLKSASTTYPALPKVRDHFVLQGEGYARANWQKRGCAEAGVGSGDRMWHARGKILVLNLSCLRRALRNLFDDVRRGQRPRLTVKGRRDYRMPGRGRASLTLKYRSEYCWRPRGRLRRGPGLPAGRGGMHCVR